MSIIDLNKYRNRSISNYSIKEYDSYYECVFVKDYNRKFPNSKCNGIEIKGVYAIILKTPKSDYHLVAIHFFKGDFTLPQVLDWLEQKGIILLPKNKDKFLLKKCKNLIRTTMFEGNPIVLYERGTANLEKSLEELSENISTRSSEEKKGSKIILVINGVQMGYIPRITFDKHKDIILCNGNCIVADYIDEYNGNVGFYLFTNPSLPMSFIFTENTTVYIDIIERENGRMCVVEYQYELFLRE